MAGVWQSRARRAKDDLAPAPAMQIVTLDVGRQELPDELAPSAVPAGGQLRVGAGVLPAAVLPAGAHRGQEELLLGVRRGAAGRRDRGGVVQVESCSGGDLLLEEERPLHVVVGEGGRHG